MLKIVRKAVKRRPRSLGAFDENTNTEVLDKQHCCRAMLIVWFPAKLKAIFQERQHGTRQTQMQYKHSRFSINPLMGTGNYIATSNFGKLVVDGWAVTFGTARRGMGGAASRPGPSSLYQM